MNLEPLKNLCSSRPGGLKKLAADIPMSEANLHRCLRNNKMMAEDIEKVCQLLNVPLSTFLDEPVSPTSQCMSTKNDHRRNSPNIQVGNNSTLEMLDSFSDNPSLKDLQTKISFLEREVSDLRNTIKDKNKIIFLLTQK